MNNMNDDRSYSGLVEKYIGTAYDKVALVADNIEAILHAADHILTHHNILYDRHDADCHPMEAITGLVQELIDLNIKIGSSISDTELVEAWNAIYDRVEINTYNAGMAQKADLSTVEALTVEVSEKASSAELAIIVTALANKVEVALYNAHVNNGDIHPHLSTLVTKTMMGQAEGVAPLDGAGHVPARHLPAIPNITHTYELITHMLADSANITKGEMSFVYGEGRPSVAGDAPVAGDPNYEGLTAAAWILAHPRIISDKNGEYIAKIDHPTNPDLSEFYFYGDWVPSHGHTPDECGAAPVSLVDVVIAHKAADNPHNLTAATIPLDPRTGGNIAATTVDGALHENRGVVENLKAPVTKNTADIAINTGKIAANKTEIALVQSELNSHKGLIHNNPHGVSYDNILGIFPGINSVAWNDITAKPPTYPPSGHNQPWSTITGKPLKYEPVDHTHYFGAITGINRVFTDRLTGYLNNGKCDTTHNKNIDTDLNFQRNGMYQLEINGITGSFPGGYATDVQGLIEAKFVKNGIGTQWIYQHDRVWRRGFAASTPGEWKEVKAGGRNVFSGTSLPDPSTYLHGDIFMVIAS